MSSSNPSDRPVNEEIISDIIKDFADNVSVSAEADKSNNVVSEQKPENPSEDPGIPDDFETSDTEDPKEAVSDDLIDEEKLKDLEITLSEEEKEERHKQALNYKMLGNEKFKQEQYLESISFYTDGLRICPLKFGSDRAVLYANRGASKGL